MSSFKKVWDCFASLSLAMTRFGWDCFAALAITFVLLVNCGGGVEGVEEDEKTNNQSGEDAFGPDQKKLKTAPVGDPCFGEGYKTCTPDRKNVLSCEQAYGGYAWIIKKNCGDDEICIGEFYENNVAKEYANQGECVKKASLCAEEGQICTEKVTSVLPDDFVTNEWVNTPQECCEKINGNWNGDKMMTISQVGNCPMPKEDIEIPAQRCWFMEELTQKCQRDRSSDVLFYQDYQSCYYDKNNEKIRNIRPLIKKMCSGEDDYISDCVYGDIDISNQKGWGAVGSKGCTEGSECLTGICAQKGGLCLETCDNPVSCPSDDFKCTTVGTTKVYVPTTVCQ